MSDQLRIEHYKALKEEYRQYLFQVQQFWIFKITTLGAVVAAAIFNDKIGNVKNVDTQTIIAGGLLALPVLAFMIDLKTMEVGLHTRLVSEHLKRKFADVPEIVSWESGLWISDDKTSLASVRTILTMVSAVAASLAVLVITLLVVNQVKPGWSVALLTGGIVSVLVVASATVWTARQLRSKLRSK